MPGTTEVVAAFEAAAEVPPVEAARELVAAAFDAAALVEAACAATVQ